LTFERKIVSCTNSEKVRFTWILFKGMKKAPMLSYVYTHPPNALSLVKFRDDYYTPTLIWEFCSLRSTYIFYCWETWDSKHKSVFYFYNKDCLTTRWCIGYLTFHFGLLLYIQHNSLEYIFSLIRKRDDANMISSFTRFSER